MHLASQPEEQEAKKTREDVDDEENNRLFCRLESHIKSNGKESPLFTLLLGSSKRLRCVLYFSTLVSSNNEDFKQV